VVGASLPFLRGGATKAFVFERYRSEISEGRVRRAALLGRSGFGLGRPVDQVECVGWILISSDGIALFRGDSRRSFVHFTVVMVNGPDVSRKRW